MRRYKAIILLYTCPILVKSWSGDAHGVILDIAISNMEYETKNHLIGLTQTDDYAHLRQWLIDESTWADKEDAEYPYRGENPKYHFVHTSTSCGPYDAARDCGDRRAPGVCLVTGITKHIRTMVSARSSKSQRVTALKYLIHFLADLHQPLHVGFRSDRGGNAITGVKPYDRDLHSIWDYWLVRHHKDKNRIAEYLESEDGRPSYSMILGSLINLEFKQLTEDMMRQKDLNLGTDIEALIVYMLEETSRELTCPLSYSLDGRSKVASGDTLRDPYIAEGSTAVANQIIKAGVRLAKLMDALAAKYQDNFAEFLRATAEQEAMKQAEEEMKRILDAEKVAERAAQRKEKKEKKKVGKQAREIAEAEEALKRMEREAMGEEDELAKRFRNREKREAAQKAAAALRLKAEREEEAKLERAAKRATEKLARKQASDVRAQEKKAAKPAAEMETPEKSNQQIVDSVKGKKGKSKGKSRKPTENDMVASTQSSDDNLRRAFY